jgi:Activator of Hsp90 ATPase homolog 1-like protein
MKNKDFQFSFTTSKSAEEVFAHLIQPNNWWVGVYGETIEGKSTELNDEFTFKAGSGAHFSIQKLIEIIPGKRIAWSVTESNLSFLEHTNEWSGTKFGFDILSKGSETHVTFTHEGLVPEIECYDACSSGWTQYLQNLKRNMN